MDSADIFRSPASQRRILFAAATLLVVALVVGLSAVAWVIHAGQRGTASGLRASINANRRLPPLPLPPSAPMAAPDIAPEDARRINAGIPFSDRPNRPARPFLFVGSPVERESARTCLASALWYEAGDDPVGQQAVAQVVLNRMRHPAFPKNICAVVFQGAERKTGCQFTFTCDGALARTPSDVAWKRARTVAEKALAGYVFKPVGTATHYHTDWIVPYWASTLDKITEIHTHIFYRWKGWWGEPGAFSGRHQGSERIDPRIGKLVDPAIIPLLNIETPATDDVVEGEAAAISVPIPGVSLADLKGSRARLVDNEDGMFVLELNPDTYPGSYAIAAYAICKDRPKCVVMGWIKPNYVPRALPVMPSQMLTATFMYRRNKAKNSEEVWWNCKIINRDDHSQCRPGTEPEPA